MKSLKKTISIISPSEKKRGMWVLVLVMGMALLETAGIASVMPFLALLGNKDMLKTNPILSVIFSYSHDLGVDTIEEFFILLGTGAFLFIVASSVYRMLTLYLMNKYIEMCRHSISSRLLNIYLHHPYSYFINHHSGEMSKNILSEVDLLIANVVRPVYNMIAYTLVLIAILVLLILVNPWLALLATGMLAGLYAIIFLALRNKLKQLGRTLVDSNKERFMTASEAFSGIKDIKMLGCEASYISRFNSHSKEFAVTIASHQTLNQVPKYLIEAFAFGGIIFIIIILIIVNGGVEKNSLGEVLPIVGLYAFSAYRIQPAMQAIFQGFLSLRYGQATVDSLYSEFNNSHSSGLQKKIVEPLKVNKSIALEKLYYTYPKAVKPSLIDLNFEVKVGSTIGIVGTTGAGKTTIVDVILGLLRPTQGSITVDGDPVTDSQIRSWQQLLGYVPQEIILMDTTIAENIAFGIPTEQIDQIQVENCARMAQVHEFIVKELPEKYNTKVGERGLRLSGGQRQRIGIARALYRNPEILLFDEATSALDTLTEQAVMHAIAGLVNKKTIIIVAHRLNTVKICDQIILMNDGKIQEVGDYAQLSLNNKIFGEMVKE